jgi:hypothetical protein
MSGFTEDLIDNSLALLSKPLLPSLRKGVNHCEEMISSLSKFRVSQLPKQKDADSFLMRIYAHGSTPGAVSMEIEDILSLATCSL